MCNSSWWSLADTQGNERWPAVPLELAFNVIFVIAILPVVIRKAGRGQLFHLYLCVKASFDSGTSFIGPRRSGSENSAATNWAHWF